MQMTPAELAELAKQGVYFSAGRMTKGVIEVNVKDMEIIGDDIENDDDDESKVPTAP